MDVDFETPDKGISFSTPDLTTPLSSPISTISLSSPMSISEREQIYNEMNNLRREREILISKQNIGCSLGIQNIRSNSDKCVLVTGLSLPILETLIIYAK